MTLNGIRVRRCLFSLVGVCGLLCVWVASAQNSTKRVVSPAAASLTQDCLAPSSWFTGGDNPTPPYDFENEPQAVVDCDFYKFAWQTFLNITQSDTRGGTPRFLTYKSPGEVFNHSGLFAIPQGKASDGLKLTPWMRKSDSVRSLDSIEQAISRGVVVDKNGHPLYYGLHLNPRFEKFIADNNYQDLAKLKAAPADQEFPVGCVELKSSWRIIPDGGDASNFFTIAASVPTLIVKDGKITIDPSTPKSVTVALVGLHVVGRLKHHPEFVWATFEHVDNAPDLSVNASTPDSAVTDRDWTFCPNGALKKNCNLKPGSSPDNPLCLVDEANQILAPVTPIYREFPFGGDDSRAIISLTTSVHTQLPDHLAVWRNYELIGATWLDKPYESWKEGRVFTISDVAGATHLTNSTMETYTQQGFNCFDCHNTMQVDPPLATNGRVTTSEPFPAKRLNISHILTNAFFQGQELDSRRSEK
jgi:hypothetical protein